MPQEETLLTVNNLKINFHARGEIVHAVKNIHFSVKENETVAIVGESGSGKSVTAMALTKLLPPPPACQVKGSILYKNQNIMQLPLSQLRKIRGKEIAYIFQDASTSLNPVFSVGDQIAEAVKLHLPHIKDVKKRVVDALEQVGIRKAYERYDAYPHELSGGMQQRIMIAMALVCEPKILVADEPTTALDVTIQKQIIDLLQELKAKRSMSIVLITHNFGIIRHFANRVLVMFKGEIVEQGPTDTILDNPQHPYTQALINCVPQLGSHQKRLMTIDYSKF